MKKNLVIAGVLLAVLALSACGQKSAAAPAEPKKELSLWTWKVAMAPGFEEAGKLFEAKTGYKVTVEAYSPDDAYRNKVLGAANSGDLPDLINWWATRGIDFTNVLVEFTGRADAAYRDKFSATAFNNSIIRETDVNNWANDPEISNVRKSLKAGQIFQVPIDVGGFFTIYGNNEILAKYGLDNKAPADYEEFIEYASKAAQGGDGGFIFAGGLPDVYYNWMGRAVEAQYLTPEGSVNLWNNRTRMADPNNIVPLKFYERLCKSGAVLDGIAAMNIDQGDAAFAAGEAAYLLGGTFTYGNVAAMGMDVSKVFSFVVPMIKESKITTPYGINPFALTALSIPQNSKNQDAAWDYINFVTQDPDGIAALCNAAYLIPAGKLDSTALSKLAPAILNMYNSLVDEKSVTTIVDDWPDSVGRRLAHEELYKDMQRVLIGEMTAEQAAANYDKNIAAQWASGNQ
ncbi:MAG: ABC transporter substrate-binding protein [Treponema sp.]|jgi:multiple sugar transport system substrate-binding protein|nr:ABC transporter substrate-binding protein [Treponema sp.]